VIFYTFAEPGLAESFQELYNILKTKNITVGEIYKELIKASNELFTDGNPNFPSPPQIFNILIDKFETNTTT